MTKIEIFSYILGLKEYLRTNTFFK